MKCLRCDEIIKPRECYDFETNADHVEYWAGVCPKCGAVHKWEEVFVFTGAENLRIVEEVHE